jgi:hypothetical protein
MSLLERDAQLLRLETALEEARQGDGATAKPRYPPATT